VYQDLTVNLAVPTISSFTPAAGIASTDVTITGTNFYGVSEVSFGGTPASFFTVNSSTEIIARIGLGSTGNIVVTAAGGTATSATAFSFIGTPAITSFTPTSTGTGQTVAITGTNFTGVTAVSFGGTAAASFIEVSATSITAVVASGTTGTVSVTTPGGQATLTGFTFIPSWTGATSTAWNTATNWSPNGVPGTTTDVYISSTPSNQPIITSTSAVCNNLTIASGAILTIAPQQALTINGTLTNNSTGGVVIQSDATGTGSLIVNAVAGSGTTSAQRWMTAGSWHLVSSPVVQTVSDFLTANTNVATNGSSRGMMDYDPTSNSWNAFFTNGNTNGNLGAGRGFSLRLAGLIPVTNDAAVTFAGALQAGTQPASGLTSGKWNCIGNPYSSAIGINNLSSSGATNNFITVNAGNLDPSYGAVYVWDNPDANNGQWGHYTIISNTPTYNASFDVQQGQAFMVLTDASKTSVSFTSQMQFHSSALALKTAPTPWPAIKLVATVSGQTTSTLIAFNSSMSKGLDPTYDAGLLKGGSDLLVYTKLVKDNGIPFAIQALPDNDFANMVIPVGLDFKTGGDVSFSSENLNLPSNCKVILEDKLTKTFTDLSANTYKAAILPNSTIADRFQLHTSTATIGAIGQSILSGKLNAYAIGNTEIRVVGEVSGKAVATLYDVLGKPVTIQKLNEGILNVIPLTNIKPGVYILSVEDNGITNYKLRIVN
jgi:hypothetical protein